MPHRKNSADSNFGRSRKIKSLVVGACIAAGLSGCAGGPSTDGVYCYRYNPSLPDEARFRTCTTGPIPHPDIEKQAKQFQPAPDFATLYVVRNSRGDTDHLINVKVDDRSSAVETIPRSFVRMRLASGAHRLTFDHHGTLVTQDLQLRAGEVRFVALAVVSGLGGVQYGWQPLDPGNGRELVAPARLVADVGPR